MAIHTSLSLERLEDRCVPDGNVIVYTDGLNNVIIQGDGANNTIVIEQLGNTEALLISGRNATLINGADVPYTAFIAQEPKGSVRINMNAGNDTVIIRNINRTVSQILGDISINFGRGGASLWVDSVDNFAGKFTVTAGDGSFFTKWNNFAITGPVSIDATRTPRAVLQFQVGNASSTNEGQFSDLTIRTGRGNDTIVLRGTFFSNIAPARVEPLHVGNNLFIDTGSGNDTIRTEFLEVLGSASFRLGTGADTLDMLEGQFFGSATFALGSGNDTLSIQGTSFQKGASILSGGSVPDADNISLAGLSLNGNLKIVTGDDDDTVSLVGTQIVGLPGTTQGQLSIQTGRGQDYVELINVSVARDMAILLGSEDDVVSFSYVNVGGKGTIDGGPGNNVLSRVGLSAPQGLTIVNFP